MLYLRLPHFHGQDVRTLQEALGALGFSCGEPDAIFGTCTERAVREFQRNSGLSADGIVGLETVRTVERLRHVWQGKAHLLHASSPAGSLPAGSGLAGVSLVFRGRGDIAWAVAGRAVNLALAHDAATEVVLDEATGHAGDVIVEVRQGRSPAGVRGPVVTLGRDEAATLPMRLAAGLEARADGEPTVTVELLDLAADDEEMQRAAVRLLDALRSALA